MEILSLKKDASLIAGGQWVDQIPGLDDARLRVRGLTSPIVISLRSRKERQVPKDQRERDGSLKPEASMRVFSEVLAEGVLLEWDGFTSNGEPVAYDKDTAKEWLSNPDFRAFADAVTWAANVVDNGNAAATDDAVGNSAKPSRGK